MTAEYLCSSECGRLDYAEVYFRSGLQNFWRNLYPDSFPLKTEAAGSRNFGSYEETTLCYNTEDRNLKYHRRRKAGRTCWFHCTTRRYIS
jgi:hypothetical protein